VSSLPSRIAIASACLLLLGCGGPARYRLTGSVTFNGQPVPAGQILFEPDAAAGNKGPAGSAFIVDGKYDTGKFGVVGGKYIITINGSDKGGAKPLFTGYQVKEELAQQAGTKDFTVPASAAKAKPPSTAKLPPDE